MKYYLVMMTVSMKALVLVPKRMYLMADLMNHLVVLHLIDEGFALRSIEVIPDKVVLGMTALQME